MVIVDVTLGPPSVPVRLMTGLFPPPTVADRVGEAVTFRVTGTTRVFEDPVVFTVHDPVYGLLAAVRPVGLYETESTAGVTLVFAEHVSQLAEGVVTTVNPRLAGGEVRLTVAGCGVVKFKVCEKITALGLAPITPTFKYTVVLNGTELLGGPM
jgi:hypothetical protein